MENQYPGLVFLFHQPFSFPFSGSPPIMQQPGYGAPPPDMGQFGGQPMAPPHLPPGKEEKR